MKIKITGKELKITEDINDYVEKKLDRIDKYFEEAEAEVTLKTEKNEQIIFTCITHKTINEYAKNLKDDKVNALKAVEGRFKEIYLIWIKFTIIFITY